MPFPTFSLVSQGAEEVKTSAVVDNKEKSCEENVDCGEMDDIEIKEDYESSNDENVENYEDEDDDGGDYDNEDDEEESEESEEEIEEQTKTKTSYKTTTEFERGIIIGMKEAGLSNGAVSRKTGRSRVTISTWWERYKNEESCKRRKVSGRPRVSTEMDDRQLIRLAKENRCASAHQLNQMWSAKASDRTVRRRRAAAIRRCVPPGPNDNYVEGGGRAVVKRKSTESVHPDTNHGISRFAWADAHVSYSASDWARVIFSDEVRFCHSRPNRQWHVRPPEMDTCTRSKSGSNGVLVWGAVWVGGRSDLVKIDNKQTNSLTFILASQIKSKVIAEPSLLQQDNALVHQSNMSSQTIGINKLTWPTKASDMSPIENVWDILHQRIWLPQQAPFKSDEFFDALESEWHRIPQSEIDSIIWSMPNRIRALRDASEGQTAS